MHTGTCQVAVWRGLHSAVIQKEAKGAKELEKARGEWSSASEEADKETTAAQADIAGMQNSFAEVVRHLGPDDPATMARKDKVDREKKAREEAKPIHKQIADLERACRQKDANLATQNEGIKKTAEEESAIKKKLEAQKEM